MCMASLRTDEVLARVKGECLAHSDSDVRADTIKLAFKVADCLEV